MIFTISCILCFVFQLIFLIVEYRKQFKLSLLFKGLASLCFVLLGIYCIQSSQNTVFSSLILTGLILDAAADVVFNIRFAFPSAEHKSFYAGTALFFAGHILYLIALFSSCSNVVISLTCGVIIAYVTLYLMNYSLKKLSLLQKIVGIIYLSTIILMTSVSLVNLAAHPVTETILFASGALLFVTSDIMLISNTFGEKKFYPVRVTYLVLYYIAQLLIAYSLFYTGSF